MNIDREQEVVRIGKKLEKITHSDLSNEEEALGLLKALQGCSMSLDVLQKSRVGLSVNKIRQKYSGTEIASVAKKLIKSWKKLLPGDKNGSQESTPKSKSRSNSPKSTNAATPTLTPTAKPSTPPPVAYSQQLSQGGSSSSESNSQENGQLPSRRLSSTSDENIILNFSPSIEGYSRVPSTGSDVRDRCRDLLMKALRKGFDEVSIEEETKFYNLAAQIEECIYCEFNDVGNKYKQKVRSRISNLGDIKNPSLRQNVISGHIAPAKIAVMTTEEMASDAMKLLRKQITKEAIRDAQVSSSAGGTKTDLLKCSKCGKRNCTYTQAQTRSADEPMTTFVYCNECGYRWKFC